MKTVDASWQNLGVLLRWGAIAVLITQLCSGSTLRLTFDKTSPNINIQVSGDDHTYTVSANGREVVEFDSLVRYTRGYVGKSRILVLYTESRKRDHNLCLIDLKSGLYFEANLNQVVDGFGLADFEMAVSSPIGAKVFEYWHIDEWSSGDNSVLLKCRLSPNHTGKGIILLSREDYQLYFYPAGKAVDQRVNIRFHSSNYRAAEGADGRDRHSKD